MKKISILLVSVLVAVMVVSGCGKKTTTTETGNEVTSNTNSGVVEDKTVGVFKFTKTSLIYKDGQSILETTVSNTSDKDATLTQFLIHVKDANGTEIATMVGFVGDTVKANSSKVIDSNYPGDLTGATTIEYEVQE